ncbi:hypothetical protein HY469_01265 [Candidatus Roizmanbacteria bacterium]|nr:hypothetical protein [Candidatus Roizmanbacteria bacterium]
MKKNKSASVLTKWDINAIQQVIQNTVATSENRMKSYIDTRVTDLKEHTDGQSQSLKKYIDQQTEDLANIIADNNTMNDQNYVRREEFEKHLSDPHAT